MKTVSYQRTYDWNFLWYKILKTAYLKIKNSAFGKMSKKPSKRLRFPSWEGSEFQILGAVLVTVEIGMLQDNSNYKNETHPQRDILTLKKMPLK